MVRRLGLGRRRSEEERENKKRKIGKLILHFFFFCISFPNSCLRPQFIESNGDERLDSDMMCGFAEVMGLVNSFPEGLKREGEWGRVSATHLSLHFQANWELSIMNVPAFIKGIASI